jgi:hypothetical protein
VDPQGLHVGDALEVLADEGDLGLTVDVPGVEPVQELSTVNRPQHQLPLAVQPLSAEGVLGVFDVARVHGVGAD